MSIRVCSSAEFLTACNERNFNPPVPDAEFSNEFEATADHVKNFLQERCPPDTFQIWPNHNHARFVDVSFATEDYLNKTLLEGLQVSLRCLPEAWMVCLWEACHIFVTPTDIFGFDATFDDAAFQRLLQA